jgi:hypothetical protein
MDGFHKQIIIMKNYIKLILIFLFLINIINTFAATYPLVQARIRLPATTSATVDWSPSGAPTYLQEQSSGFTVSFTTTGVTDGDLRTMIIHNTHASTDFTVTIPSSYEEASASTVTTITIVADSYETITWRRLGSSSYLLYRGGKNNTLVSDFGSESGTSSRGIWNKNADSTGAFVSEVIGPLEASSDDTTALTTGTAKLTFRMPYAFTLTSVRGTLATAQASGSIFTVDINESGTTVLSTKLTIDNTEKTSTTAATAAVISDTSLADDAEITIDIDQIGTSGAAGLKIWLIGTRQ